MQGTHRTIQDGDKETELRGRRPMRRPKELTGNAAKYWDRNAPHLMADGMLTDKYFDGFVLLCKLWSQIQAVGDSITDGKERVWYIGLTKQFQALSKQYGLLPRD